jgi:predicted nucleic acid-binding protein
MPAYLDSSLLLSMILKDARSHLAEGIWSEHSMRVSSFLTELECITVLRRIAKQHPDRFEGPWLDAKRGLLAATLETVSMKAIDSDVLETVRHDERLGVCRTLDAIHLATALLFQRVSEEPLVVCTLDQRMADACRLVGLPTLPL